MHQNYWSKVLNRRLSRRRALAATAFTSAGAAFLMACGTDDDPVTPAPTGPSPAATGPGVDPTEAPSLLSQPTDRSGEAIRGGTLIYEMTREPGHFDGQAQGQAQLNVHNGLAYASLLQNVPGYMEPSSFTAQEPNTAEGWEFSGDGTVITFKIRPGVRWHNKPPVNGREFTAEDVAASWQRYISLPANNRAANANEFNPAAPIISVEATDSSTVVMTMTEPSSYILARAASMITGELGSALSYPMEAGIDFDPEFEQIGTGGFVHEQFEPSVANRYVRNEDYWHPNEPYIDRVEFSLLSEYSARLAQLRAGNLLFFPVVTPEDILVTKQDRPELNMYTFTPSSNSVFTTIGFGLLDLDGQPSPFRDVRVRRAISMSMDRETYIQAFNNVDRFEAAGLPVEQYWYTALGYLPGWMLDARDPDLGENAAWVQYSPEEARKLLAAAGFEDGFEYRSHAVSGLFAPPYNDEAEVLDGWAREIGLNPIATPLDYNQQYLPEFITQQGRHPGILYRRGAVSSPDPVDYYLWRYWSRSGPTSGALGLDDDPHENGPGFGVDVELDSLIDRAKAELDHEVQRGLVHDIQRYLVGQQYCVPRAGFADTFQLAWQALANFQVFQGDSRGLNQGFYTWWIDETKPPYV